MFLRCSQKVEKRENWIDKMERHEKRIHQVYEDR